MKKVLLFSVCLIATTLFAQDANNDIILKPLKKDIGFSFNLTGLINNVALSSMTDNNGNDAIILRQYINDDLAFRLGLGIKIASDKWSTVDSVGSELVEWDSTFKKVDIYVAPGIEKHFLSAARLDPYVGMDIRFGKLGKSTMTSDKATTDTLGTGTLEIDRTLAGGISMGLNLIAGFNYFFSHKICIGAEYSWGFMTSSNGGDWRTTIIDTPADSPVSTTTNTIGSNILSTTGFAFGSTAGITLSYFFTRDKKPKKEPPAETDQ